MNYLYILILIKRFICGGKTIITFEQILPLILLFLVNLAVIFRRIGKLQIPAWTAFLAAAVIIVLSKPGNADKALTVLVSEVDVFVFLFGMFVIVTALEMSGVLEKIAKTMLKRTRKGKTLLLFIHIGFGLMASILINDTVAIIAPIILISFAKYLEKNAKPFIIAVAISLSFGSALLPSGNPQNFILASTGEISYLIFALWALLPTLFALLFSFLALRLFYRKEFNNEQYPQYPIIEERYEYEQLAKPALISLILMILGMSITSFFDISMAIPILIVSVLFLFFTNKRTDILAKIDWGILLFFAGMFVVIDAVTTTPFIQDFISTSIADKEPTYTTFIIFILIIFLASQIISNVPVAIIISQVLPLTTLNLPVFWIGAALATTFAGATSVLGAASNIIVLETASKRGVSITWFEFTKIGLPISLLSLLGIIGFGGLYFLIFL